MKNLLFDARQHAIIQSKQVEPHNAWKDFPPNWIEQKDWVELVDFWNSGDWRKRHEAGKQNRAKGAIDGSYCLHTGGSICFDEWGQREVCVCVHIKYINLYCCVLMFLIFII